MNDNTCIKKRYEALARTSESIAFPSPEMAQQHCKELNDLANMLHLSDLWVLHDSIYLLRIGNS